MRNILMDSGNEDMKDHAGEMKSNAEESKEMVETPQQIQKDVIESEEKCKEEEDMVGDSSQLPQKGVMNITMTKNEGTENYSQQLQEDEINYELNEHQQDGIGGPLQLVQDLEKKKDVLGEQKEILGEIFGEKKEILGDNKHILGEKKEVFGGKIDVSTEKKKGSKVTHAVAVAKEKIFWDPFQKAGVEVPLSAFSIARLKKDIEAIFKDPIPLMFIAPEEDNIHRVHAIICGPEDTPYEGGFFYFFIKVTSDYPLKPPQVKFMTTGNGLVRFNPNLYANGMICLSTLGTWPGPPWTAAQSIQSLLISIQSLLNETPYNNEPGFKKKDCSSSRSRRYNEYLRHETLRVAVCDMLDSGQQTMPSSLYAFVKSSFLSNLDFYEDLIEKNLSRDGENMFEPYRRCLNKKFDYTALKDRFLMIKARLRRKRTKDVKHGEEELMDCMF